MNENSITNESDNEKFANFVNGSDALFHYTRFTTAIESILATGKMRLSSLQNTNDPQEYKFLFFNSHAMGNVLDRIEEKINCTHTQIDRIRRLESRILCFCQNDSVSNGKKLFGYTKSRMWAQYGDNHKGICLVFSKIKLKEAFKKIISTENDCFFDSVNYQAEYRMNWDAKSFDGNQLDSMDPETYALSHLRKHYKSFFFTKNIDYKDENEYRVLVLAQKTIVDFIDINDAIKGIIVGDKCHEVYNDIINMYAKKHNCQARQLYWSNWVPYLLMLKEKT